MCLGFLLTLSLHTDSPHRRLFCHFQSSYLHIHSLHTAPLIHILHIQGLPSLLLILHNLNLKYVLPTIPTLRSGYLLNKFAYVANISNNNSPVYHSCFVLHWQYKAAVNQV